MVCYHCGSTLSEKDFCTSCGADVGMYKKILALSNRYYNNALEKCQVRDLTGAINDLKQSIKLNKNNVDAHNLLGLIYYEIGEIGEALGQWVISSNIRDNKNIALDYIKLIQDNPAMLDSMDAHIKKFNYALQLSNQDSLDIAVIQLKNILGPAPKYLKAHQLLALIYIHNEEWELAEREVAKCEAIDVGSTIVRRYKHEIEKVLEPSAEVKAAPKKSAKDKSQVQVYKSGNDTIIQPLYNKQSSAVSVLLNIGLGIIIGIAITYFLILPSKIYSVNETAKEKIAVISDEKDKKTSELETLKQEMTKLSIENEELKSSGNGEGTSAEASDALMMAVSAYLNDPNDLESIATALENVENAEGENPANRTAGFIEMYDYLMNNRSVELSSYYFERGFANYNEEEYEEAIPDLRRAYRYNEDNGDALFYLATALRRTGQEASSKELYAEVMDRFPGTERATRAETYLAEMNNLE